MAYKELYNLIEGASVQARVLAEQVKNPDKDYSLGTKTPTN